MFYDVTAEVTGIPIVLHLLNVASRFANTAITSKGSIWTCGAVVLWFVVLCRAQHFASSGSFTLRVCINQAGVVLRAHYKVYVSCSSRLIDRIRAPLAIHLVLRLVSLSGPLGGVCSFFLYFVILLLPPVCLLFVACRCISRSDVS